MILIVVSVHSISTDRVKIGESIQIIAQVAKLAVCAKVRRICAGNPHDSAADHIFAVNETDILEFAAGEAQEILILHGPQIVALVAEIFQTQPDGAWVGNQRGAPIIENLQSPDA